MNMNTIYHTECTGHCFEKLKHFIIKPFVEAQFQKYTSKIYGYKIYLIVFNVIIKAYKIYNSVNNYYE